MTALLAYVERHPVWSVVFLLIICGAVSNVTSAVLNRRGGR